MASRFTVRVLLHGAGEKVYDALHTYMLEAGFSKHIDGEGGVKYQLPPAEYNLVATKEPMDVLHLAKKAASRTGHEHQILVSPCDFRVWSGLDQADVLEVLAESIRRL